MGYINEPDNPKREDIVLYRGDAYYFQPLGTSCRLYDREEQIGINHSVSHTVYRHNVTKAPFGTVVIFHPSSDESEIFQEFDGYPRYYLLYPIAMKLPNFSCLARKINIVGPSNSSCNRDNSSDLPAIRRYH